MDPVDLATIISYVGNFGFPLVLAIYLLLRFEKKIELLTQAINDLKEFSKEKKEG